MSIFCNFETTQLSKDETLYQLTVVDALKVILCITLVSNLYIFHFSRNSRELSHLNTGLLNTGLIKHRYRSNRCDFSE